MATQLQIEAVATILIVFRHDMNIVVVVVVFYQTEILVLIKWVIYVSTYYVDY
jgi:hypothetical protein